MTEERGGSLSNPLYVILDMLSFIFVSFNIKIYGGKNGELHIMLSVLGFKDTAIILRRIFMFD